MRANELVILFWPKSYVYTTPHQTSDDWPIFDCNPTAEKYVFSVFSNSTVSFFASTPLAESLAVSGPIGTTGFVKVTIAKDLISNIADLEVYFDITELDYAACSIGDSWLLYFTYEHNTR